MKDKSYIAGFLGGLLIVLLIGVILRIYRKKQRGSACEYDERQEAIRGTGFKYAYFTGMLALICGGVIEVLTDVTWSTLFPFAILSLWLSICVFVTYCVIRDAYFSLRSRRSLLIIIFLIAAAVNLFFGVQSFLRGEMMVNGMLSLKSANLITGASCLYLGLMMLVYSGIERRREVEE